MKIYGKSIKIVNISKRVGKWVVYIKGDSGYFEHDDYGEGGGLWFSKRELCDYDGVYELPKDVVEAIELLKHSVPKTIYI